MCTKNMGMKTIKEFKGLAGISKKFENYNWLYSLIICACFFPFMSPAIALFIGLLFSIIGLRHENLHKYTSKILQASIVLMGFGMSLETVISSSKTGFMETIVSVTTVMLLGIFLGRLFKVEKNSHYQLLNQPIDFIFFHRIFYGFWIYLPYFSI